ncbi:DUF7344 domain-containing protein [Natronoglomus mannanivorans]|uniref:DUF7344 domain-containing protein n=1 Tax=Natronoglomus mannanivorans TaxID=2979990 RepID=A0AAP2YZ29_9EURY|nr:hypothetical protein [Halobacteria archaeon AArc-xg1-1]
MKRPSDRSEAEHTRDTLFRCLANGHQRYLLGYVHERSSSGVAKSDLATWHAATIHEKALIEVTDSEHERARTELHHKHLPMLEEAGLIECDEQGSVTTTDHPAFEDSSIVDAVTDSETVHDESLDALFDALADSRRRTVLSVLGQQYHPISLETLARDVAARESNTPERDVPQDHVQRVLVRLTHVHLPLLGDTGLVDYDTEANLVSYEGHPDLRVQWLESSVEDVMDSVGSADPETTDVQTLEGTEIIVSHGQSLCEEANEELFMLFSTTGLLEEGCFARIEDALDRGVDVYLGSRDPVVRETVRERAPEVVLWEPQLDWLNLSSDTETVGRLVFADRDAIMLGTVGEKRSGGSYDEKAIVGKGADNGLVTLMGQLLGSRIDHLDSQTEDVLTQLSL